MARAPVQPLQINEPLKPQAEPVDTFVRAAEPTRNTQLMDLAQGLKSLDAGLSTFLEQRKAKSDEEDAIRGEAAFHKNNRQGYAEAVAQGLVPAYSSQAFVAGYKRSQGSIAGYDLEQRFNAAYDAWDGKSSQDPKKFDEFLSGFLKENIKTSDPEVLRGLMPRVRALQESASSRYSRDRSKSLMDGNQAAAGAEANIAIDSGNARGLADRTSTDYGRMFSEVEAIRAKKLAEGLPEDQLDAIMINAVTAKAIEKRDPKILDFFDRLVPGKTYKWGDTPYGQVQKGKTIEALETMGRKAIVEQEKARKEAEKKAGEDVTRKAITSLATNPDAPFPEDLLKEGEKYDPEFRININKWRENIRKNQAATNPTLLMELNRDLIESGGKGTMDIIRRGIENGVIANKEDLVSAYKLAEEMQKNGGKIASIKSSAPAKEIRGIINKRTQEKDNLNNPFAAEGMSDTGLAAAYDFDRLLMEWVAKNPNASGEEQEKAVAALGAIILGRLTREGEGTGPATYDRRAIPVPDNPYASGRENPKPPAGTPNVTPGSAPVRPQGGAAAGAIVGAQGGAALSQQPQVDPWAAKTWFDTLPPETQAKAQQRAAATGQPLSAVVTEAYSRMKAQGTAPPAAPPAPTGNAPEVLRPSQMNFDVGSTMNSLPDSDDIAREVSNVFGVAVSGKQIDHARNLIEAALNGTGATSRNYSLATINDDPKAARILDFVAGPESAGNYNAFFGNTHSTKDLSKMTFNQVVAWMGNRGTKSSATGRYQFMKATLIGEKGRPGLMQEMAIDGNTLFTPELQDRMAMQLLRRRGYDRWVAGKMSTNTFANNLAREWASLPNLQTGRSHYAGDGLNKSLVSPGSVLKALGDPA